MRVERLFSVLIYLLHQKRVSAKQLASYFEVTTRTIYRDLEALQMSGVPIISYPGKNGGYALIESYSLSAFTFTEAEKALLLNGLALQKDIIGEEKTRLLEQKLLLLKQDETENTPYLFQHLSRHHEEIMQIVKMKIKQLEASISNSKQVQITYIRLDGNVKERVIYPAKLLFAAGNWYLLGFCTLKNAMRQFKLTRILQLSELAEDIPETFTYIEQNWNYDFGTTDEKMLLKLRFDRKNLAQVYDYFLPDAINMIDDDVYVEMLVAKDVDILYFISTFSETVEIVEPTWLRITYLEKIEKIRQIYL